MKKLLGGKILLILVCVLLGCVSCMNDGGSDWVGKCNCVNVNIPMEQCREWTAYSMDFRRGVFWHIV